MTDWGRVAVLMGGDAAERDVSLRSGAAVLEALHRQKVDAYKFDPSVDSLETLKNYDRAFIVLHGRGGEDGQIQAVLQALDIPYTGSGVMSSAIGMDKYRSKLLWKGAGLATPDFIVVHNQSELSDARTIGFPMMVKPIQEGSSIGISRVENDKELDDAWQLASQYDSTVLLERWVTGREYTCAILNNKALPIIELRTPNQFYDYAAKYEENTTEYICPCDLDQDEELQLRELALQAFQVIGASGWGRVDFMLDEHKNPWLIEINTVPGMTDHSLVPMSARQAGLNFDQLVIEVLAASEEVR